MLIVTREIDATVYVLKTADFIIYAYVMTDISYLWIFTTIYGNNFDLC